MSKITNDGLTRSGTGCFIAVPQSRMATVGVRRLIYLMFYSLFIITLSHYKTLRE